MNLHLNHWCGQDYLVFLRIINLIHIYTFNKNNFSLSVVEILIIFYKTSDIFLTY